MPGYFVNFWVGITLVGVFLKKIQQANEPSGRAYIVHVVSKECYFPDDEDL
jgi:hypothetical protein